MKSNAAWVALLLVVTAGGGLRAGDEVRVAERWTAPDVEPREMTKIFVVGITSDREARRNFENKFVSHLRGRDYDGATSHSLVADLGRIENRREVLDKIAELGIDSALSVRVVPLDDVDEAEWADAWEEALGQELTLRQLIEQTLPDSETTTRYYGVEVALWDAASGRRIWAGRTEAHTMKRLRKGAGAFVQDVLGTLKLARLL